jgi:hypothetical protein
VANEDDHGDDRTPAGAPTAIIADRLERLGRALSFAGNRLARFSGVVERAETPELVRALEEIEEILGDVGDQGHGARRAVERIRRAATTAGK